MLRVVFRVTFFVAATESLSLRLGPQIPDSLVPKKQLSIEQSYSTATTFFFNKNTSIAELSHNLLEKASCGMGLGSQRLNSRM